MAAHATASVDDHPLLTARHVDDLTQAVRGLTICVVRVEALLQKLVAATNAQRTIPPMPEAPPRPGAPGAGSAGGVSSSRATAPPQRRKAPR